MIVSLLRWLFRMVAGVAGLAMLYLAAALAGALIPVNADWAEDKDGIPVIVRSNGIHLEFVLPHAEARAVWMQVDEIAALAGWQMPPDALAFGWGERDFFLGTPGWENVDPGIALGAVLWQDDVLVRVIPVYGTPGAVDRRELRLSQREFAALVKFIREAVRLTDGKMVAVDSPLYDPGGIFIEGRGTYTPFYTCNGWVNDGLSRIGVRTALWSPFPQGVLWQGDEG